MRRTIGFVLAVAILVACGDDDGGTRAGATPASSSDSHLRVEKITADGIDYRCIVFEHAIDQGAAGGLWCERIGLDG